MNNTLKLGLVGIAGVIIGLIAFLFLSPKPEKIIPGGGSTNFGGDLVVDAFTANTSITLGSTGTAFTGLNGGTCQLQPDATTIAASTTARVTCHGGNWSAGQAAFTALTGITSSSKIVASLSTTTAGSTSEGLILLGVTASTTSGFIEARISNQTGTTYTWSTSGSASGTMQYIGIK